MQAIHRKTISVLALILVVITSCTKEDCDELTVCDDFANGVLSNSYFVKGRFQYTAPYFNPKNSNEFVYNYIDFEEEAFKLMTYNISTGEDTEIADDVRVINQPKWSSENWIAFDNIFQADYHMNIVKSNGTERRRVSSDKHNLYPAWGNDGETLYWFYSEKLSVPNYFVRYGLHSSHLDTLSKQEVNDTNGVVMRGEISDNNIMVYQSLCDNVRCIATANVNESPLEPSALTTDKETLIHLLSLSWGEDDHTIYYTSYKKGLYKLDVITGELKLLLNFCDTKYYRHISYSKDCHCLIAERVDTYRGELNREIVENSSIYLIDLNTLEETAILE